MYLIFTLYFRKSCIFIGRGNFVQAETEEEGGTTEQEKGNKPKSISIFWRCARCIVFSFVLQTTEEPGSDHQNGRNRKKVSFGCLPHFLPAFQQRDSTTSLRAISLPLNSLTWDFGAGVGEERPGMEKQTPMPSAEYVTSQFPRHKCAGLPFRVPGTVSKEDMKRIIVLWDLCLGSHTSPLLRPQRGRVIGLTSDVLLASDQEKYTYRSLILYETNSFCLHLVLSYHASKTGL